MLDEIPFGLVIEGAVKDVQPKVGARKTLSKALSDPLPNSISKA